jgi:arsenate reductase
MEKRRVLILCTGNSARSQMAEGLLRHDAGDRFEVESAGTKPGIVRPEAIAVMKEVGIDITAHRSKHVEEFNGQHFDYVLTVCNNAKESCPVFFATAECLHHGFTDPAIVDGAQEKRMAAFRTVRDEIRSYLKGFPQG